MTNRPRCPYITSVGATKIYPGHTIWEHNPESAANDLAGAPYSGAYSSGGGFGNTYETPSYQKSAVAKYGPAPKFPFSTDQNPSYFKNHDPAYAHYNGSANLGLNGGLYNRIGRGIPDVSANGDNIAVVLGGETTSSGGTSASSPIFASIITLVSSPFPSLCSLNKANHQQIDQRTAPRSRKIYCRLHQPGAVC